VYNQCWLIGHCDSRDLNIVRANRFAKAGQRRTQLTARARGCAVKRRRPECSRLPVSPASAVQIPLQAHSSLESRPTLQAPTSLEETDEIEVPVERVRNGAPGQHGGHQEKAEVQHLMFSCW